MEKYKYFVRLEQIKEFIRDGRTKQALEYAEGLDHKKIRNNADLAMLATLYLDNGINDRAGECLRELYGRAHTHTVLMQLVTLAVRKKEAAEAEMYYSELAQLAPDDFYNLILRYNIDKIEGKPYPVLIDSLERLKEQEYMEEYAYELAKLYHKVGDRRKCITECNNLIVWFGDGEYVDRARALKAYYEGELDLDALEAYGRSLLEEAAAEAAERADEEEEEAPADGAGEAAEDVADGLFDEAAEAAADGTLSETAEKEADGLFDEATEAAADESLSEAAEAAACEAVTEHDESEDAVRAADEEADDEAGADKADELRETSSFDAGVLAEILGRSSDEAEDEDAGIGLPDEDGYSDIPGCIRYEFEGEYEYPIAEGSRLDEFLKHNNCTLETFFGFFAYQGAVRNQLIKATEILLNPQIKSTCVAISGGRLSGKSSLAKGLARLLNMSGFLKEKTCAVTDADRINKMELSSKLDRLDGKCLVIEGAGRLSSAAAAQLLFCSEAFAGKTAVIISDTKSELTRLFRDYRDLNGMFPVRLHIPSFDGADLLDLVHTVLRAQKYGITEEADAYLAGALNKYVRLGREGSVSEIDGLAEQIIDKVDLRGAKGFIEETLAGRVPQRECVVTLEDVRAAVDG